MGRSLDVMKQFARVMAILLVAELMSACVPLVLGTTYVTAVDILLDRRTVGRTVDDTGLELKLRQAIRNTETLGDNVNISVTSVNGIVLLTGEVPSDQQRKRATALARVYPETRQVVNEIALSGKTNLTSRANDAWITLKVKAKLANAKAIPISNIKVVTERAGVYLLGLVTRSEAERAVAIAKSVPGARHIYKVFEYIDETEASRSPAPGIPVDNG